MTIGSSPFVDNPSNNYSLQDITTTLNLKDHDLKVYISKLEYQVKSFETERKLYKQEKESITSNYESIIKKKNDELDNLKLNFDYIFNEKNQLEDKFKNQQDTNDAKFTDLIQEIKTTKNETTKLNSSYNELKQKYDRLIRKHKQVTSDWNYQIQLNDDISNEIKSCKQITENLQKTNNDLVIQLKRNNSGNETTNYLNKISNLQNTNIKLQAKLDQLLQNKTSNELLKQKNVSLMNKVISLEDLQEKYIKLEVEKLQLENKYNELFKSLTEAIVEENQINEDDVTNSIKVQNFINIFKESQIKNLTLQEKLNDKINDYNVLKQDLEDHVYQFENEYLPTMNKLQEKLKVESEQNLKLERTRNLNLKEIEFLRNSLKQMDELKQSQPKEENKSMNQYVTNLEKLVDDYKTKLNEIKKVQPEIEQELGHKRPKIERHSFKSQAMNLEKENMKLTSKIHQLQFSINELQSKLSVYDTMKAKKEQILQFKNNLLYQDQMIKQETLNALREENLKLIDRYVSNLNSEDLIPRAIFQRQEDDKNLLQIKIDQLLKKNSRLKECYTKKSKDIITIISRYFGFLIEFLPNPINNNELSSRLKLTSRYMTQLNSSSYLILDIDNKSLKAYGNYEFKSMCEELANEWVVNKNQFPCLLSALNLKIYEIYANPI